MGEGRDSSLPSNPPVTACINVYNDVNWLRKCLESLQGKVKAIVVVDGAYEGFPYDKPYSTDGTIDLAKELADVTVIKDAAWPTETIKRNHYIQYVPVDEWWLRIDADEELVGTFDNPLNGICYRVMLRRSDCVRPYPIHALFKRGKRSRIYGTHHGVWYDKTLLVKFEDLPVYGGIELLHHMSERTKDRSQAKGIYYRGTLTRTERKCRQRFKI